MVESEPELSEESEESEESSSESEESSSEEEEIVYRRQKRRRPKGKSKGKGVTFDETSPNDVYNQRMQQAFGSLFFHRRIKTDKIVEGPLMPVFRSGAAVKIEVWRGGKGRFY